MRPRLLAMTRVFRRLVRMPAFAPSVWLTLVVGWSVLAWRGAPVIAAFAGVLSLLALAWPLLAIQLRVVARQSGGLGDVARVIGVLTPHAGSVLVILAGGLLAPVLVAQHPLLLVAALAPAWGQRFIEQRLTTIEEGDRDSGNHS